MPRGTYYAPFAEMTAQDAGDRRPNGYSYAVTVCRRDLPRPEEIGVQAARRTLDLLGAKKIKTETLPVIIENQNVGRLLGGFLGAMFGRSIQQKRSFLADKKGQRDRQPASHPDRRPAHSQGAGQPALRRRRPRPPASGC